MLELLKKKEKVIGIKQTQKAAEQNSLEVVFIACDAEEKVVGQVQQICEKNNIDICVTDTMKQLGKMAGIDVGASVVGVIKS